jgi:hypothetical protein
MNFCVLVKISKHKISLWYQSGRSTYEPLVIKNSNEIPLYFYVNGTDFVFGDDLAIDRFNSNDPNSFGNYFDIIKDPSNHFIISGNKKPVKQLLYHGIEKYLNFFITQVLYKNDSLESYRQNFPLRFWFEQDIEEREKSLIENLFTEAGYDNIDQINYNPFLFEVLVLNNVINSNSSVLMLNGINNTLYLELYKNSKDLSNSFFKLDGYGADPSVKILAEMMLEDILAQESYLTIDKEKEVNSLLTYSADRLENITPIIKGDAILTDGKKHYFEVKQRVLNDRLLYYSNDSIMYAAINDLLSVNNIINENLVILLGSKEINTAYLINKLLVKYPNVIGIDDNFKKEALKSIFAKISKSGYIAFKKDVFNETNCSNSPSPLIKAQTVQVNEVNNPREHSTRISSPPVPPRFIPPLSSTNRVVPQPIPSGLKPPLVLPVVPVKKVSAPSMPPLPPTKVNTPPITISVNPPPIPVGSKLPPPPPPPPPKIKK